MEITYRRNLSGSFMCVEDMGNEIEERELIMMQKYKIPGLLSVQVMIFDGKMQYWYEITGKQQLPDYLAGKKIGKEELDQILYSIRLICEKLKEYLLLEERVCLEPECMYIDIKERMLYVAYMPFETRSLTEQFRQWMEQVLKQVDHQDREGMETAYGVYEKSRLENINMEEILNECIPKIEFRTKETVQKRRDIIMEDKGLTDEQDLKNKKRKNLFQTWIEEKIEDNQVLGTATAKMAKILQRIRSVTKKEVPKVPVMEELKVKPEIMQEEIKIRYPTEVLCTNCEKPGGRLFYQGKHDCSDFWIEKEEFLIGRNAQQVDGMIKMDGVSRVHAKILRREDAYYIEDLNSTNGTYLNGELLEYHLAKKLNRNDRIRFGIEEYVFC